MPVLHGGKYTLSMNVEQSKDVNSKSMKRRDFAHRIDHFICSLNEIKVVSLPKEGLHNTFSFNARTFADLP
jgi:hypothetical protein